MNKLGQIKTGIMILEITSFSYKAPLPAHIFALGEGRHGGGFVFDCRSLPNPGREEHFKLQTGLDSEVIAYLNGSIEVAAFREHTFALVSSAVTNFLSRGFEFMNVSFGCTGGQHRSVYLSEQLANHIAASFSTQVQPQIIHYNLKALGLL